MVDKSIGYIVIPYMKGLGDSSWATSFTNGIMSAINRCTGTTTIHFVVGVVLSPFSAVATVLVVTAGVGLITAKSLITGITADATLALAC